MPRTDMSFKVVGKIAESETIAVGTVRVYGERGLKEWKSKKGMARLRFENGRMSQAEVHWFEVGGVRKGELKIKRFLE